MRSGRLAIQGLDAGAAVFVFFSVLLESFKAEM